MPLNSPSESIHKQNIINVILKYEKAYENHYKEIKKAINAKLSNKKGTISVVKP